VVLIEHAWLWRAQRGQHTSRIPSKDGTIRHIREACDRKRSCSHAVREIVAGRRLRSDSDSPAMRMDIDGNGFPQDRPYGEFLPLRR
jgi:hypothetical protein